MHVIFINNSCPAGYLTQNYSLQVVVKGDKVRSDLLSEQYLKCTWSLE